jgi:hypothetical protein
MRELQILLRALQTCTILPAEFFEFDCDDALDQRDADPFEKEWVRLHRELREIGITAAQKALLEEITKTAFLNTMQATANSELAGYISDDFDLLCRGLIADAANRWLNGLGLAYCENRFPFGELKPLPGSLREIINENCGDE